MTRSSGHSRTLAASRAIVEIAEAVLAAEREQGVGIVKELPVIP